MVPAPLAARAGVLSRNILAALALLPAPALAAPVTAPYLETFNSGTSSFTPAPAGNTAWSHTGGKYRAAITANSVAAASTVQAPALPAGFHLQATLSGIASSSAENTMGLGFLGGDATFSGTGSAFYLADIKPGSSKVRLVEVGTTNSFLIDGDSLAFTVDPAQPLTLAVDADYEGTILRMTVTVTQGANQSIHAIEDETPLAGSYFGLRCRTNGSTTLTLDYDDFTLRSHVTAVFTQAPAAYAKPGVPYSSTVAATSLAGGSVTIGAVELPAWLSLTPGSNGTATLSGTPPEGVTGPLSIKLQADDGSGSPATAEYPLTVLGISGVVISEFMASSDGSYPDEDGDDSDWLELFNADAAPADLTGWVLKDDQTSWALPAGTVIPPYGTLVVFASDKNRTSPRLHTNFKLSSSSGGYLALARPNATIASQYSGYPAQREGISYGMWGGYTSTGYLLLPTPGAANAAQGYLGFVADPTFSLPRGSFSTPQSLTIQCPQPGTTLRYTTDGSLPTATNGTPVLPSGPSQPPSITLPVASTSVIRAVGFLAGYAPSHAVTHTYLFPADVITQSPDDSPPAGWPAGPINGQILNYGMDPDITTGKTAEMKTALASLPTFSLVTDRANLFDPLTGIYVNAYEREKEWEQPTSLEMIKPDGTSAFQINCGMRMRGGVSRADGNPKHSFHFYFRGEYGETTLAYPLFGTDGAPEFDRIDLRTTQGGSWHQANDSGATYMKDEWSRATQGAMGQAYTRSRYCHLYINGVYWGVYATQERADNAFAASYFGGEKEDYDVIKTYVLPHRVEAADGDATAWNELHAKATAGFAADADYYAVQGLNPDGGPSATIKPLVEIDNLIDYMILAMFTSNTDGPVNPNVNVPKNFYCFRPRDGSAGFRFVAHDFEDTFNGSDVTGYNATGTTLTYFNPRWLHLRLADNAKYRARFADRVQRNLFNTGALATPNAVARWNAMRDVLAPAMIAESARWGDFKSPTAPHTVAQWTSATNSVASNYLVNRPGNFITLLRNNSRGYTLFPSINAPVFSQFGGAINPGFNLTVTGPGGASIFYTTDGTDPSGPGALPYGGAITLNAAYTTVKARARSTSTQEWSALTEAVFTLPPVAAATGNLVISEFSYNPPTSIADPDDLSEFIELLNPSSSIVDLTGVKLTTAVTYTFPALTLEPGKRILVIKNESAFRAIYGAVPRVAGIWSGSLNQTGEPIVLVAANGTEIERVVYSSLLPWPTAAADGGRTLVRLRPDLPANSFSSWRASAADNGTPGGSDASPLAGWLLANGFAAAGTPGPGGLPALVHYAAGLATNPVSPPAMRLETNATHAFITLRRRLQAMDDVRFFIERSDNLGAWPASTEVDSAAAAITSRIANADGTENITVQLPLPAAPAFFRIRYTTR